MSRHPWIALTTATVVTAMLGLSGCSNHAARNSATDSSVPPATSSAPAIPGNPLPAPEALVDVLTRLSDPAVPGSDKVVLVQGATPDSAAVLDKYTNALRDNGYLPMTFVAERIAWADQTPSDATATINITAANNRKFSFPMEFTPYQGGWQLSHKTAEMLLALGNSSAPPPSPAGPAPPPPSPGPPAPPTPSPTP